jgi:hypothetical protein
LYFIDLSYVKYKVTVARIEKLLLQFYQNE